MKKILYTLFCIFIIQNLSSFTISVSPEYNANLAKYTFKTLDNKEISLKNYEDSYLFLDVWSMGCGQCLRQMPLIDTLQEKYTKENIKFYAICIEDNYLLWKEFVERRKLRGNHLITPIMSDFMKDHKIYRVPSYILINDKGHIFWSGSVADIEKLSDKLINIFGE